MVCKDYLHLNNHVSRCLRLPSTNYFRQGVDSSVSAGPSGESQDLAGFAMEFVDTSDHAPETEEVSDDTVEMMVRWREVYKIPNTHIQQVKKDVQKCILANIKDKLTSRLQTRLDANAFSTVEEVMQEVHLIFRGIQSAEQEKKASANLMKPVNVHVRELGFAYKEVPSNNGTKRVKVADVCVDCRVEDQIEQQVWNDEIYNEFIADKRSLDDDLVCDIQDGSLYRNHPMFGGPHTADNMRPRTHQVADLGHSDWMSCHAHANLDSPYDGDQMPR